MIVLFYEFFIVVVAKLSGKVHSVTRCGLAWSTIGRPPHIEAIFGMNYWANVSSSRSQRQPTMIIIRIQVVTVANPVHYR